MSNTRLRCTVFGVACLSIIAWAGCGGGGVEVDPGDATEAPFESEASKEWETPTDAECQKLAEAFESAAASGNARKMGGLFDWDALFERATGGIKGVDRGRRQFIAASKQSQRSRNGLTHQLAAVVEDGGSLRFLRVRSRAGKKRILFRLLLPEDGGVNYYDMIVVKQPGGKVRIIDVYTYLTAEMLSTTARRVFLSIAAAHNKSILQKLTGEESDIVKHDKDFIDMAKAIQSKRFRRVLQIYNRLPKSLQQHKNILMIRLKASQEISDEEYEKTIVDFRKYHPDDPCVDFISIDKNILDEKYDAALDSVDRLDKSVGGDPHLDVLRANLYLFKEDSALAKKRAERAIKAEPTLLEAYWVLINVSLIEQDFDGTTQSLRIIEDKFGIEFEDLTTVPEYSEYVKSPQYQEWLEARTEK